MIADCRVELLEGKNKTSKEKTEDNQKGTQEDV